MEFVAGLCTALATGGFPWGRALDGGGITGRGTRGILRVLAETGGEIGHLLTEGSDFALEIAQEDKESGLGGGGDLLPKFLGNRRLLRHGLVVGSDRPRGYI